MIELKEKVNVREYGVTNKEGTTCGLSRVMQGSQEREKGGQSVGVPGTYHLASGVPERYLLTDTIKNWKEGTNCGL